MSSKQGIGCWMWQRWSQSWGEGEHVSPRSPTPLQTGHPVWPLGCSVLTSAWSLLPLWVWYEPHSAMQRPSHFVVVTGAYVKGDTPGPSPKLVTFLPGLSPTWCLWEGPGSTHLCKGRYWFNLSGLPKARDSSQPHRTLRESLGKRQSPFLSPTETSSIPPQCLSEFLGLFICLIACLFSCGWQDIPDVFMQGIKLRTLCPLGKHSTKQPQPFKNVWLLALNLPCIYLQCPFYPREETEAQSKKVRCHSG